MHVLFYLIKNKSSFEPFVCQLLSCPWISYLIFLHHCSILENPLDQHKTEMFSALANHADMFSALGNHADMFFALGNHADMFSALGNHTDLFSALGNHADFPVCCSLAQ